MLKNNGKQNDGYGLMRHVILSSYLQIVKVSQSNCFQYGCDVKILPRNFSFTKTNNQE